MHIPSFTDAYFCTTRLPAILLQLFFYQVRRLQAQLFSAVCHWLYLPLLQTRSCSRSSIFTPVWYPSLCTTLFYVTALSMAYPLMQDALSAMKIPVCPHFSLCHVFTWTSLLSQQVGSTPSSFTWTITVCSHRGHNFLACPVSSHMNTDTRSSQFFIA